MDTVDNFYTCEAFGNTYPVKDSLKKLGFRFKKESRTWIAEPVSEKEKLVFETSSLWGGVKLRFRKMEIRNAKN